MVGVLTSSLDITDRKRAENHLFYMAHHDVLTNLANRALLSDRLRREIARTRRGDSPFALHLVDLDGFKDINDGLKFEPFGDDDLARFQSTEGVYHDLFADFSTNEPIIDGTVSLLLLLHVWQ